MSNASIPSNGPSYANPGASNAPLYTSSGASNGLFTSPTISPTSTSTISTRTGSSCYTTSTIGTDSVNTVFIVSAAPTTTNIITGTTASSSTTTGANCQETVSNYYPSNYGFTYSAYANTANTSLSASDYAATFNASLSQWHSEAQLKLLSCGIAQSLLFQTIPLLNDTPSTYGTLPSQNVTTNLAYVTVIFHGYLLASETGNYTWTTQSNDLGYVWLGDDAYSTWDGSNAITRTGGAIEQPLTLNKGDVLPITVLYANAGGTGSSLFQLTLPNGTAVSDFTGLLLQPKPNDRFLPPPYVDNATCPAPVAVNDSFCGTEFVNFYHTPGFSANPSGAIPYVDWVSTNYSSMTTADVCSAVV